MLAEYHNRQTHPLMTVAPQFLYARFAYAIFPRLSSFLATGQMSKRIIRVKADGKGNETEIANVLPEVFRNPRQSKSRSASPKKRAGSGEAADNEAKEEDSDWGDGD